MLRGTIANTAIACFLLAGCAQAQDAINAQTPNPDISVSFDALAQCLTSSGLPDLVIGGTDVDGFPLYEFVEPLEVTIPEAQEILAGGCVNEIDSTAGRYTFEDIFEYFSNLISGVRNDVGTHRSCTQSTACNKGLGPQYALATETVCNEYGCFEVSNRLVGVADGEISRGQGTTPTSLAWDPSELSDSSGLRNWGSLKGLDAVAAMAAPGVVVIWGDWCVDRSRTLFAEVFQRTIGYAGFFVNDSTLIVPAKATLTLKDYDRLGVPRQSWHGDDLPPDEDCAGFGERMKQQNPAISIESGKGPIVQLFDGRWATGKFLWSEKLGNEGLFGQDASYAALQLTAITDSPFQEIDQWDPFSNLDGTYPALPTSQVQVRELAETVSIHHPIMGRSDGGWQLTTSDATLCSANTASPSGASRFYLPHWSDEGSVGGPVLDASGKVIGTLSGSGGLGDQSEVCPANVASTTRNPLGPLSNFYLDGRTLAIGETFMSDTFDRLQELGANTPDLSPHELSSPTISASQAARFEQVNWGEDFTETGFPLSQLDTPAIEHLKQATLMFIKTSGCPTCTESARNLDFSVSCLCTGFAVTENLIVTNDHCVTGLGIGDSSTFRSFLGQDVNAVLIGKSSVDGESNFNDRFAEIYGTVWNFDSPQTGPERGDVALFRTTQRMVLDPLSFAPPSSLGQYDPLITVGHPFRMTRTGPFVTAVGSFIGEHYFTRTQQFYQLPADNGASGSAVVNLKGELVGQIAGGGAMHQAEADSILPQKYGLFATQLSIDTSSVPPAPFSPGPLVPSQTGLMSWGATSEYLYELIEKWAPGELG